MPAGHRIAAAATGKDVDGAFPTSSLLALREAGLLVAPLRQSLGGLGCGIEPAGAWPLALALRLIGRASLPLGRLYEGHVNALRLVQRYGTPAQAAAAARDAAAGHLFAAWNTDAQGEPALSIGLVSDGTGSHPTSQAWLPARLAALWQEEVRAAVVRLGLDLGRDIGFLGLPDMAVPDEGPGFEAAVRQVLDLAGREPLSLFVT